METKRIDPALLVLGGLFLLLVALVVFVLLQFRSDEVRDRAGQGAEVPVLLLLEDEGKILFSHLVLVNPKAKRLALVVVPENLGGIIPELGRTDSYESLYREKGMPAYVQALEGLLDYNIPFWIHLDLESAGSLVDFLGGVSLFVPDALDSKDAEGGLVRIPNGNQVLDGEKIRQYLAWVGEEEREQDVSNRRWAFTKALLGSLSAVAAHSDDSRYKIYLGRWLQGKLDQDATMSWIGLLEGLNMEAGLTQRILGTSRSVEADGVTKDLLFPHFDGKLAKDSLRQLLSTLATEEGELGSQIRLEILNGTEISGLARRARDLYASYGFDVVRFGNASTTDTALTQVIDRKGDLGLAQRAAGIIKAQEVTSQMIAQGDDPAAFVDVTIILGKDFDGWYVRSTEEE